MNWRLDLLVWRRKNRKDLEAGRGIEGIEKWDEGL